MEKNAPETSSEFTTITLQKLEKTEEGNEYYRKLPMDFFSYLRTRAQETHQKNKDEDPAFGEILTSYTNLESTESSEIYSGTTRNSFFDAFWIPYNTHSELVLSPDDIWIAIMLAFSRHVNIHSEKLRSQFVDHEGQKEIKVFYEPHEDPFSKGFRWHDMLSGFEKALSVEVKGGIINTLAADFSTTGKIEKIVSQICIMDTMKKYFTYKVSTRCGITKVHFRGKLEDWQRLLDKTKALKKYECEFWIDQLTPVLESFIDTFKGNVDLQFWNKVFNDFTRHGSGGFTSISGWILAFYPYKSDDSVLLKDHHSKLKVNIKDVPCYAAKVPFILELLSGAQFNMMFLAGFSNVFCQGEKYRAQLSVAIAASDDVASEKIRKKQKTSESTKNLYVKENKEEEKEAVKN